MPGCASSCNYSQLLMHVDKVMLTLHGMCVVSIATKVLLASKNRIAWSERPRRLFMLGAL